MILRPCAACGQHVQRAALACPHCGAIRGGKLSRSAAALVMGLTLMGLMTRSKPPRPSPRRRRKIPRRSSPRRSTA
ncbi:MAG: hypothetical protein IPI35_28000 [Deltaproteobacteria bacterium]|nr:hypothetical protein [Deltaproteobacteria bacterium]